jgi:hypothetical protein
LLLWTTTTTVSVSSYGDDSTTPTTIVGTTAAATEAPVKEQSQCSNSFNVEKIESQRNNQRIGRKRCYHHNVIISSMRRFATTIAQSILEVRPSGRQESEVESRNREFFLETRGMDISVAHNFYFSAEFDPQSLFPISNADALRERHKLPDFVQLVNYPDHLTRGKHEGHKHCVMCGHLRVANFSKLETNHHHHQSSKMTSSSSNPTSHIIPRQNKGVCTMCDIAVWMLTSHHVEIKWCKGCKNFKPWENFGEKPQATKCAKCRIRQKEKYATTKSIQKIVATKNNKHNIHPETSSQKEN